MKHQTQLPVTQIKSKLYEKKMLCELDLTLFPPTSISPLTSTNVVTNSQNFLTFSFNPFVAMV